MKNLPDVSKGAFVVVFLLGSLGINPSYADEGLSVGVGTGALYSGIGVNVGMRSKNSFGYLTSGCIHVGYSSDDGWEKACGVGAGWIWTGFLAGVSERHGLGVYVGPVTSRRTVDTDVTAVYGAGLTYVYSFGDAVAKGWQLGITPTLRKENGDYRGGYLINVGYQF